MSDIEKAIQGKSLALPKTHAIGIGIMEGADHGRVFVLSSLPRVTFGREGADVDLGDPALSNLHCVIEVYGDVILLRDLGSASGTYLNGFQIKGEILKDRDKIRLGSTVLQIILKPLN